MKLILLGISIILFGIAFILVSSGMAGAIGLGISFIGLIVSVFGYARKDLA
jgi:hypothetical protein